MHKTAKLFALFVLLTSSARALTPGPDDVYVRVIDVGAGECCVIRLPGGYNVVYDAGNYKDDGATAMAGIRDVLPGDDDGIDLLVLSHTDADHIAAVPQIEREHYIQRVLRTGMDRFGRVTATLRAEHRAIAKAVREDDTDDFNLKHVTDLHQGFTWHFGEARVTFVSGFGGVPAAWLPDLGSENSLRNNAPSIVIRIEYRGKSILFCGDAVGRHIGQPANAGPIASELHMLNQQAQIPLASDVLVAAHHGADNASSKAFIEAVHPRHVIFSAGADYEHPRLATVRRFTSAGVLERDMYRTDFGDRRRAGEWSRGYTNRGDRAGDDDVEVLLKGNGTVQVGYRSAANQTRHENLPQ